MNQSRKVLVLGATGAMGQYLVPRLAAMGYRVDGVSIDESAAGEKIEVPRAYLKGRKAEDFCAMRSQTVMTASSIS